MIIFLYGEDSYRARKKFEEILQGYKKVHKSGLSLHKIDAQDSGYDDFSSRLKATSMFDDKKLITIKNIFANSAFQESFLKDMDGISDSKDIVVVLETGKIDQRSKMFKALIKNAKCQEFKTLQPSQAKIWTKREFEKYGCKVDDQALEKIILYAGTGLWRLSEEIKKLAHYKPASLIKAQDVELHIKPKIETDIFKTIDAMASRDKKQALDFLHKHLENGDNALYLLSMIGYQFRNLLIIKDLLQKNVPYPMVAQKSGLHPFVVKKSFYLCDRFTMQELKTIYRNIYFADANIKTGKVDAETALELLISEI